MTALRQLYQEVIIDHSKNPRNYGVLGDASHIKQGFNPLCGDKVTIYLRESNGVIEVLQFEGCGCAISIASASLMTEVLRGKSRDEIEDMFEIFHRVVTRDDETGIENKLGKLAVLAGVAEYPARVKCATLAWHTLRAAIMRDVNPVSTE